MSTITELGDTIAALSSCDAADLRAYLKDRFGIKPAAAVSVAPVIVKPVAPTEFDVVLEAVDAAKRIQVIRTIRELTNQGLAEARAMAESYPKVIQAGVDATTAATTKKKLEDAGAKVAVQPL